MGAGPGWLLHRLELGPQGRLPRPHRCAGRRAPVRGEPARPRRTLLSRRAPSSSSSCSRSFSRIASYCSTACRGAQWGRRGPAKAEAFSAEMQLFGSFCSARLLDCMLGVEGASTVTSRASSGRRRRYGLSESERSLQLLWCANAVACDLQLAPRMQAAATDTSCAGCVETRGQAGARDPALALRLGASLPISDLSSSISASRSRSQRSLFLRSRMRASGGRPEKSRRAVAGGWGGVGGVDVGAGRAQGAPP